jgi:aldose 1-epimerase
VNLLVPDSHNEFVDVVAGFDSLEGYIHNRDFYGALIGRYGNRIAKGQFSLGGRAFQLDINNGANTLHGGSRGFDTRVWEPRNTTDSSPEFVYVSPDGEEWFPGNLVARVTYTITSDNSLDIDYGAITDSPTIVNLTNHAYFNLNGWGSSGIDKQLLQLEGD